MSATAFRSFSRYIAEGQVRGSRNETKAHVHSAFFHPAHRGMPVAQLTVMLRITADSKGSRLIVEGHLRGPAIEELRKSCAERHDAGIVLDLSGVVFLDRSAAVLLKELSAAGFVIEGCSDFLKELLR